MYGKPLRKSQPSDENPLVWGENQDILHLDKKRPVLFVVLSPLCTSSSDQYKNFSYCNIIVLSLTKRNDTHGEYGWTAGNPLSLS
jgi:hypothetical protein